MLCEGVEGNRAVIDLCIEFLMCVGLPPGSWHHLDLTGVAQKHHVRLIYPSRSGTRLCDASDLVCELREIDARRPNGARW